MNDDFMKQAMEHARELQEKLAQTLGESDKLRAALMEQARRSADATHEIRIFMKSSSLGVCWERLDARR